MKKSLILTWLTTPHILRARRTVGVLLEVGLQRAVCVGATAGIHGSATHDIQILLIILRFRITINFSDLKSKLIIIILFYILWEVC